MDVVLLRWPLEEDRRSSLLAAEVPRLLLVEDGVTPPSCEGCLEDWIRVPASEHDVRARVCALEKRASAHEPELPGLDCDGLLRFRAARVCLPPVESRLMAALVDRYQAVVRREALARAGWPHGAPGRNALDVHVLRLRRRIEPVGLAIRTVRSRGYLLETTAGGERPLPA